MSDQPITQSNAPDSTQETAEIQIELAEVRQQLAQAKREAVIAKYGLPQDVAALLRSDDPAQLESDAAALARALRGRPATTSPANAVTAPEPDLTWIRDRRAGAEEPFGRGGVQWEE